MRAWRALPAFRGDSSARTWLLAIARPACADAVRADVRAGGSPAGVEHQAAPPPASRARPATPRGAHEVHALVETLDHDQRVAFVLTQVVGCSYEEAATICGVPDRHHPLPRGAWRASSCVESSASPTPDDRGAGCRRAAVLVGALVVGAVRGRDRGAGRRARARRDRAHELPDRAPAVGDAAACPGSTSRSSTSARSSSSPTRAAATSWCSDTTTSPISGSARAACSRTRGRPATYLNRSTHLTGAPPKSADPKAAPVWKQVSTRQTAQLARPPRALHGHRGPTRGRSATPTHRRVFDHWRSRCATAARPSATGEIAYVPPPSPWPCVRRAGARGRAVRRCARTRRSGAGDGGRARGDHGHRGVHVVGLWDACTASAGTKLARERLLARRDRARRCSALGVDVAQGRRRGGAARPRRRDLPVRRRRARPTSPRLGHSQIPTTLPGRVRPAARDDHARLSASGWRLAAGVPPAPTAARTAGRAAPAGRRRTSRARAGRHQLSSAHPS